MIIKCLLLFLYFLGDISIGLTVGDRMCSYPRFEHGRFRMRQKSKLIKFICFPGYQLAGNKYATCRDGEWDVPLPTCVKPGCSSPVIHNAIPIQSHNGAWVVYFCLPGYKLRGSQTIYCDGRKWNATLPTCVEVSSQASLNCSFEDAKLCGWSQDELHDFDWKRLNRKTPSSFLFTGPSYDHTYGPGGSGYYMYIESTSRLENDSARLISPVYDKALTTNGCFSFWYHMYGRTTGGLRIYQKPDQIPLQLMLMSPVNRARFQVFEKWGNQGNTWYNEVVMLKNTTEDFQIVIEGVRGTSFTSDIAIDDVAILQGDNCSSAIHTASTPAVIMPDSCSARCDLFAEAETELGCGCTVSCVADGNCCPDFFDLCVFEGTAADDNSPADLPQTQKLVATPTALSHPITNSATTPPPTRTPTITPKLITTTPKSTEPATPKMLNPTRKASTPEVTVKIVTATPKITVTMPRITQTLPVKSTPVVKIIPTVEEPDKPLDDPDDVTVVSAEWKRTTVVPFRRADIEKIKMRTEQDIQAHRLSSGEKSSSSGLKTTLAVLTSLTAAAALVYAALRWRGARGPLALQRLRARARHDPDVAYLHSDVDDY